MTAKTVLIVDDEAPIREMIAVALEMADYRVLEADNAQDAHAMVVDHQPDLLLLDWMMPGTSGIELARRLKREETTAEMPIIMLTAKGEEDNKIQGLEAGADDYITKPFDSEVLLCKLRAVLNRNSSAPDSKQLVQIFCPVCFLLPVVVTLYCFVLLIWFSETKFFIDFGLDQR